ncbi:VanW family protein [Salipaludibacillus daqingensis]|uniref:VanW family protein n=1 Tax=Salipaludibacillus daqingensis TaxID=3041001 RepID=UPI00247393B9|nr:VanW family protein [Salipaludibacillus daqingensis]
MYKWQWFVSSLIIMVGSIFFLTLFTYSGELVYSTWFEEERFESETVISNMDISELNQEEASLQLKEEVDQWKANHTLELRWFDEKQEYSLDSFNFLVDESIEELMISEEQNDSLVVLGSEQQLLNVLENFEYYSDVPNVVHLEGLLNDIEEELSSLPNSDVVINVHDYVFEDQVDVEKTLMTASRAIDSSLVEEWMQDLPTITLEADSQFSFMESMESAAISPLDDESLSKLASAIYEAVLPSNFHLIERVQNDALREEINVGFDVKMNPEQDDLVFENPNPIDYKLEFEWTNNQLSVDFIGEEFPYLINVDVVNQETISPRTIVQYSNDLREGQTQTVDSGKNGLSYELIRTIVYPLTDEMRTEQIAKDYYPPEHRMEKRSKVDLIEEDEDPFDQSEDEFFNEFDDNNEEGDRGGAPPQDGESYNDEQPASDRDNFPGGNSGLEGDFFQGGGDQGDGSAVPDADQRGSLGSPGSNQEEWESNREDDFTPGDEEGRVPVFPKYDEDGHLIKN